MNTAIDAEPALNRVTPGQASICVSQDHFARRADWYETIEEVDQARANVLEAMRLRGATNAATFQMMLSALRSRRAAIERSQPPHDQTHFGIAPSGVLASEPCGVSR